ncbi:uncharacterized protein PAC_10565 [Phialocephala subalpina]|uniref:Zn(2)-C6 fungal-type domain-containing protein n=1 Tax=Phialocephala subalpina TaxID=576137 RepID=A0A1L7X6M3_9HELO|nr:uncharacterized protein PAC_10565 [Phialocephala subalpina]
MKRSRPGAKGASKVKTGCRTCRIRRKKCDEVRPACSPCVNTKRVCDFLIIPPKLNLARKPCIGFGDVETLHFEYFRTICTREFSLYFEDPAWERIILQVALAEPCMQHAAVAIGALSRSQYHLDESRHAAFEYSMRQYNLSIQALKRRLDSAPDCELAVLAGLVFIAIEMLQRHGNKAAMLLRGSLDMLRSNPSIRLKYLWIALSRVEAQLSAFLDLHGCGDGSLAVA